MNSLQSFYFEIYPGASMPLIEKMSDCSVIRTYEKGQTLIAQGEQLPWVMFLINGVVRTVSRDDMGQEVTLALLYEYGECLLPNMNLRQASIAAIEAITSCRVACIPISAIDQLIMDEVDIRNQYIRYMRHTCDYYTEIHVVLGRYRAAEKYRWFAERYAAIVDIVPDKYIANLLGMTPVTLSRVRRKIREERLLRSKLRAHTDINDSSTEPR